MNLIDKLTGKSKRAKAARVSAANAQIEETRNKVGFFGAIFAIIAVLFMTQTVKAQITKYPAQTFEQFTTEVDKGAAVIVGRDFGGFQFNAMEVTEDRVFYMEMQFTAPGFNSSLASSLSLSDRMAMRNELLMKFAGNPEIKQQMEALDIKIRIVILLSDGATLIDETVAAEDIKTIKYY